MIADAALEPRQRGGSFQLVCEVVGAVVLTSSLELASRLFIMRMGRRLLITADHGLPSRRSENNRIFSKFPEF